MRLLNRLAIDPSLRQATIARELGVTRSAISQLWTKLEKEYGLTIRSNIDYGQLGLRLMFGWALASEASDVLMKYSRWLKSNSLVTRLTGSMMSSTLGELVYFEAIVPLGDRQSWFQKQIERFRKRPYNLTIQLGEASNISHTMNLALFNGSTWSFSNDFRLLASIDAAKGYVDVLPSVGTVKQSEGSSTSLEDLVIASAIESNYHATATDLANRFTELQIKPSAGRTLRRKIATMKKKVHVPYADLKNIGLPQKIIVCIKTESEDSSLSRVLHAQASTFPKARVISGSSMTILDLEAPNTVDWLTMSEILTNLAGNTSEICTFIADRNEIGKRLESVVSTIASRMPSGDHEVRR
ncbi:MAG: MarR family transcriptional regulator [Candidatus Thorarchaeota archaeon]|nr:MarR family transcriptional regulator [Candidatus Thorarchaeota archaeon]